MNDDFVYGFLLAVILVSVLLFLQYGDDFNFLSSSGIKVMPSFGTALNWKSAVCLSMFFGLFFKNLDGSFRKRLFDAFWILCLSWAVMDLFWILKACVSGNFLFGSSTLTFLSLKDLIVGILRNLMMFCVSMIFIKDHLKISKAVLIAFAGVIAYWIFILCRFPYSGLLFSSFIFYFVNFVPFILLLKNWSEKSWRKFLFV